MAPRNQLVIYEFHVGTFNEDNPFRPGRFIAITARLEHLKRLGANAIQIMPVRQFAGMRSWGYNSSHHFSPSNLDLWQFDGWSEEGIGILYFYNDARACTPWGETRPDYGRGEVSPFMPDNALMWLDEYRVDGPRFDIRP